MSRFLLMLFLGMYSTSCFKPTGVSRGKLQSTAVRQGEVLSAVTSGVETSKSVVTVDAHATTAQRFEVPSGTALSGTSVVIAPGTLSSSVSLIVEKGVSISDTSIANEVALADDIVVLSASPGVIIRASENVDLKSSLKISLPIQGQAQLADAKKTYAIFFKYFSPETRQLMTGIIPVDNSVAFVSFNEQIQGDVIDFKGYFGSYWVVTLSRPMAASEIPAPKETKEAILNSSQTSVMTSTGMVAETQVVTNQKISLPKISRTVATFDAASRMITAQIDPLKAIKLCKLDVYGDVSDLKGLVFDVDKIFLLTFPVLKTTAHKLVLRFRCLDDNDRNIISAWSSELEIPALVAPPITSPQTPAASTFTANAGPDISVNGDSVLMGAVTGATRIEWSSNFPGFVSFANGNTASPTVIASIDGEFIIQVKAFNATGDVLIDEMKYTRDSVAPSFSGIREIWKKSSTEAVVFWPPATDNMTKSKNIVYELCVSPTAGSCVNNFQVSRVLPSTSWEYTVSGLVANTEYEFLIRARDSVGNYSFGSGVKKSGLYLQGVSQVVIGDFHTCALMTSNGSVWCWGNNNVGQLGNGSFVQSSIPVLVGNLTSVSKITAAYNTTCALQINGIAKCWGDNQAGKLGDGTMINRSSPVEVLSLADATDISVSQLHTCAVYSASRYVKCWGLNHMGQLGIPVNSQEELTPTQVPGISDVAKLVTGIDHSCAVLSTNQALVCFGYASGGQLGNGSTVPTYAVHTVFGSGVADVAVGEGFSCAALTSDGSVYCWGSNSNGQLGIGSTVSQSSPQGVSGIAAVSKLSTSGTSVCGVLTGGTGITCWGNNGFGQLGDAAAMAMSTNSSPVMVNGLSADVVNVTAGSNHTCALVGTPTNVLCWGNNDAGQLGFGVDSNSPIPASVQNVSGARSVALGDMHTCAVIDADGSVKCWGNNSYGQLGNNTTIRSSSAVVTLGLSGVRSLALNSSGSCAVLGNGDVKCWGQNYNGGLGTGGPTEILQPTQVSGVSNISKIVRGSGHTCALDSSTKTVKCWGENSSGQLGNNSISQASSPTSVSGLSQVVDIAAASYSTCALLENGTVKCWGANFWYQLADGTDGLKMSPVLTTLTSPVSAISAGANYFCAVMQSDRSLTCWADNQGYQINAVGGVLQAPAVVPDIAGVNKLGLYQHSCSLMNLDGSVKCWGSNTAALGLSLPNLPNAVPPTTLPGLEGVLDIATGYYRSCIVTADKTVKCWGLGYEGALGTEAPKANINKPLYKVVR
ncbi:MAG: hypothetical protein EOP04_02775 [Proteobacteria bacterium]|nr:MAG: hypothetical protein EOP04_02775 [Pseudomonadota bacterium]